MPTTNGRNPQQCTTYKKFLVLRSIPAQMYQAPCEKCERPTYLGLDDLKVLAASNFALCIVEFVQNSQIHCKAY